MNKQDHEPASNAAILLEEEVPNKDSPGGESLSEQAPTNAASLGARNRRVSNFSSLPELLTPDSASKGGSTKKNLLLVKEPSKRVLAGVASRDQDAAAAESQLAGINEEDSPIAARMSLVPVPKKSPLSKALETQQQNSARRRASVSLSPVRGRRISSAVSPQDIAKAGLQNTGSSRSAQFQTQSKQDGSSCILDESFRFGDDSVPLFESKSAPFTTSNSGLQQGAKSPSKYGLRTLPSQRKSGGRSSFSSTTSNVHGSPHHRMSTTSSPLDTSSTTSMLEADARLKRGLKHSPLRPASMLEQSTNSTSGHHSMRNAPLRNNAVGSSSRMEHSTNSMGQSSSTTRRTSTTLQADARTKAGLRASMPALPAMADMSSSGRRASRRPSSTAATVASSSDATSRSKAGLRANGRYSQQQHHHHHPPRGSQQRQDSTMSDLSSGSHFMQASSSRRSTLRAAPPSLVEGPPESPPASPAGEASPSTRRGTRAGLRGRPDDAAEDSTKFGLRRTSTTSSGGSGASTEDSNDTLTSRPGAYRQSLMGMGIPEQEEQQQQQQQQQQEQQHGEEMPFSIERMDSLYKGGMTILGREGSDDGCANNNYQDSFADLEQYGEGYGDDDPEDVENPSKRHSIVIADVEPVTDVGIVLHNIVEEDDDDSQSKSKNTKMILAVGILIILGLIGAIIGVAGGKSSDPTSSSDAAIMDAIVTNAPSVQTNSRLSLLFDDPVAELPAETIVSIQYGEDNDPRVKAFNWVMDDPNFGEYSKRQLKQRFVLAIFYYSTNGDKWFEDQTGPKVVNVWVDYATHECDWFSMWPTEEESNCATFNAGSDPFDHHDFTSLVLRGEDFFTNQKDGRKPLLKGTIAPELSMLTSLHRLDVGAQKFQGSIPATLTELSPSLKDIILYNNVLTGVVPQSFYTHTERLWLSRNKFDPSFIPPTVGPQLTSLGLTDAQITGSIPKELFAVTNLQELFLSKNNIDGGIPTEIGIVGSSLQQLELFYNQISGALPSEVGLLTQLTHFSVEANSMTGTISPELGSLRQLTALNILGNHFSGTISSALVNLSNLRELKLSSYQLQNDDLVGTLDVLMLSNDTAAFHRLETLWVSGTKIGGIIPTTVGLLTTLTDLRLESNSFSSSAIPTQVGSLTNLKVLGLANASLVSSIPSELGLLTALEQLRLNENDLTGELPEQLYSSAATLKEFRVEETKLFGSIPDSFCGIKTLDFGCGTSELCGCDCSCG